MLEDDNTRKSSTVLFYGSPFTFISVLPKQARLAYIGYKIYFDVYQGVFVLCVCGDQRKEQHAATNRTDLTTLASIIMVLCLMAFIGSRDMNNVYAPWHVTYLKY